MEDFVPFEIAKKLKEKGFSCEYPFAMYDEDGEFYPLYSSDKYYYGMEDFNSRDFIAPIISQVLKWLREKKKIFIDIRTSIDLNGKEHFSYYIIHNKVSIREGYTDFDWKFELAALAGIEYVIDNNLI